MPAVPSSPAWAPHVPAIVLDRERGILAGAFLGFATWGVLFTLTIQCISVLVKNVKSGNFRHKYYIPYVLFIFSLSSVDVFITMKWFQAFLIDNSNFPGGPMAYYATFSANRLTTVGRVCAFAVNWLADGLLIYRLFIVWESKPIVVGPPLLTFLASFALSVAELTSVSKPGGTIFNLNAINFGLVYWTLSVTVNVLVTTLIVVRMLYMRRQIASIVGDQYAPSVYFSVSAMLVESASLYTGFGILLLIGYGLQNSLQFVVEILEVVQGVAPLMIILRVARGIAYSDRSISEYTKSVAHGGKSFGIRSSGMRFASRAPVSEPGVTEPPHSPIARISLVQDRGADLRARSSESAEIDGYPKE